MLSMKRAVGWAACMIAAALLSTGSAAAAAKPIPDDGPPPTQPVPVVIREVRLPLDDTRNEIIQIILAAALGTCLASAASGLRSRRPDRRQRDRADDRDRVDAGHEALVDVRGSV